MCLWLCFVCARGCARYDDAAATRPGMRLNHAPRPDSGSDAHGAPSSLSPPPGQCLVTCCLPVGVPQGFGMNIGQFNASSNRCCIKVGKGEMWEGGLRGTT